MYQPPRQQPEIDLEQILEKIKGFFRPVMAKFGAGGSSAILLVVVGLVVALWLFTGFYQVRPAQLAAVRLFGAYDEALKGPGLHWFWPAPLGTRNVETVTETRRLELGFRSTADGSVTDVPFEALMITGDLNIVDVQLVIQYRIKDLGAYLFNVDDPGDPERNIRAGAPDGLTLKDATEVALRQVVGQRSVDDILTINKEAAQADARLLLQTILDDYGSGLEILEVRLQNVRPPDPVRDAFDDVVRARVDKEARINEALAYQQSRLPRARGDAQRIFNLAEAFKQERILKATGEANRFNSVLEEYVESKQVTRQRMYLEAMEEILPGVTKVIINPENGGNLLEFLPLSIDDGTSSGEPKAAPIITAEPVMTPEASK
jgi:membrane protease subunit HflK